MSVLVAALARTKNNFTNSLHRSDRESKMSATEKNSGSKFLPPVVPALGESATPKIAPPLPLEAAGVSLADEGESAGPSYETHESFSIPELQRQFSTHSCFDSEEDECESAPVADESVLGSLGPIVPLKEQLERDKEDESLRRWKEQLLGSSAQLDSLDEVVEPEVTFLTLDLTSPGRPVITIPLPLHNSRGVTFTLKEGSVYRLKFTFTVHHNIVSGLKYVHTVWKAGLQVDHTKIMLGTFSPQREAYIQVMGEETTPSGILARGSYSAKTKFVDDDERCYLEIDYSFEIRKEWSNHRRGWSLGSF